MALEVAFLVLALEAGLFQKLFYSRCRINFFKQGVVLGERYFKYQIVHDRQTLVERGQKRNSKKRKGNTVPRQSIQNELETRQAAGECLSLGKPLMRDFYVPSRVPMPRLKCSGHRKTNLRSKDAKGPKRAGAIRPSSFPRTE